MNTYLANTNLEPRIFDSLAATLQAQDPRLRPMSGRLAAAATGPAHLALLTTLRPDVTKVALMTLRNRVEALAQDSRDAQVWRNWKSVTLVQCGARPLGGTNPVATAALLDVSLQSFPKRASVHLAMLEYTLNLHAQKVQSCRIFHQDDPALCVSLLDQAVTVAQDAGAARCPEAVTAPCPKTDDDRP